MAWRDDLKELVKQDELHEEVISYLKTIGFEFIEIQYIEHFPSGKKTCAIFKALETPTMVNALVLVPFKCKEIMIVISYFKKHFRLINKVTSETFKEVIDNDIEALTATLIEDITIASDVLEGSGVVKEEINDTKN